MSHPLRSALSRNRPSAARRSSQRRDVQVWIKKGPRLQSRRWLRLLMVVAGIVGASSVTALSLWVSILLILRPHPPQWLVQTLPAFFQDWGSTPLQSLAEIELALQGQGQEAGPLMSLARAGADKQLGQLFLLPVFEVRSPCTQACREVVALRLYRNGPGNQGVQTLQLLDQLAVQGPSMAQVGSAIARFNPAVVDSTRVMPLSQVQPLPHETLPGGWLTLTGLQHQSSSILYGQIIHVDLRSLRLYSLLNWQSPPRRLPTWHNLDGAGAVELVVNQSVGLEPRFAAYNLSRRASAASPQLIEISLIPQSLPAQQEPYEQALLLAQRELWSPALQRLQTLKGQLAEQWQDELEQQLQLVAFHAQVSQHHAKRDWGRPSQKLLTLLLDGQWSAALQALEAAQADVLPTVLPLLKQNSIRIWRRLAVSLQVQPNQPEARILGALLLLAKEDEKAALQWLGQASSGALRKEFQAIALKVNPPAPPPVTPVVQPAPAAPVAEPPSPSGLLGTARPLAAIAPQDWQAFGDAGLSLPAGEQWYEITLQAQYQYQRWRPSGRSLRLTQPLPLTPIQAGQPGSTPLIVRAIRQQTGVQLLASGAAGLAPSGLVVTPGYWRSLPSGRPVAADPAAADAPLLEALKNHLDLEIPELLSRARKTEVDLTDAALPETLFTVPAQAAVPNPEKVQVLMNAQGEVLYSSSGELLGWLASSPGDATLVIQRENTVRLLNWSAPQKRFVDAAQSEHTSQPAAL